MNMKKSNQLSTLISNVKISQQFINPFLHSFVTEQSIIAKANIRQDGI